MWAPRSAMLSYCFFSAWTFPWFISSTPTGKTLERKTRWFQLCGALWLGSICLITAPWIRWLEVDIVLFVGFGMAQAYSMTGNIFCLSICSCLHYAIERLSYGLHFVWVQGWSVRIIKQHSHFSFGQYKCNSKCLENISLNIILVLILVLIFFLKGLWKRVSKKGKS